MELLKPGAGLAVVAGLGALILAPGSPLRQAETPAEPATSYLYRVIEAGEDTGCDLALAEPGRDGRIPLVLGKACAMQASVARVSHWADRDDGTVELSDDTGTVAMRLASGDGSAFEAFGAGAPLVMLVEAGR
jgi:hypothetical protein